MAKPYERPVAPDEAKQGAAEAVEAARAQEPAQGALSPEPTRKREPNLVRDANRVVGPVSEQQPGRTGWPYGETRRAGAPIHPSKPAIENMEHEPGRDIATNGKRPDATLADAIAPQLGLGFDVEVVGAKPPGLSDKFVAPPFSVLDTRAGYWQERRRAWLSIGFRGETHGRAEGLIYQHDAPGSDPGFYTRKVAVEQELGHTLTTEEYKRDHYDRAEVLADAGESVKTGTSVFDPVLCEVAYRWFSGEGAQVLDPFAGGVVRGAVAAILGRRYWGCELRPEQIADNRRQADVLFGPGGPDFGRAPEMPLWHEGDSTRLAEYEPPAADLVFTCPPYGSLEVYSDDPRDLSTMSYEKFRDGLFSAMKASSEALRSDRFAVWVVGEFRDKAGMEAGFVSDMTQLAMLCGLRPYNSAILLNSVGSAALRAQMILKSRKLTRVHQHVLVFCKGDPKRAAAACGSAEVDV